MQVIPARRAPGREGRTGPDGTARPDRREGCSGKTREEGKLQRGPPTADHRPEQPYDHSLSHPSVRPFIRPIPLSVDRTRKCSRLKEIKKNEEKREKRRKKRRSRPIDSDIPPSTVTRYPMRRSPRPYTALGVHAMHGRGKNTRALMSTDVITACLLTSVSLSGSLLCVRMT